MIKKIQQNQENFNDNEDGKKSLADAYRRFIKAQETH